MPHAASHFGPGAFELAAPSADIAEQDDIVFERIRTRDVVIVVVLYAKDQPTGLIFLAGNWLEFRHEAHVAEWPAVKRDGGKVRLAV